MSGRIVADSWYAEGVDGWTPLEDVVPARWRPLVARSSVARGVALALAARRSAAVVTTNPSAGASVAIALMGLLGLRRLVLLEYIVHPPTWRRPVHRLHFVVLRRVLLGRALLWAQVLTRSEIDGCAASHRLPADRFRFIPWPGRFDDAPVGAVVPGRRVLASGRRSDWATFFAAARDAGWDVRAVCSAEDLAEVESLAAGTSAVVRHEISAQEHHQEVAAATVYVIPLPETGASIGQIRVMNAAQAGVPVVATAVRGLADYVDDTCAVTVPPGDPAALRAAVDALLDDPSRRERLRDAARHRGATMQDYRETLSDLVAARQVAGSGRSS
jgi:hypothetical protein